MTKDSGLTHYLNKSFYLEPVSKQVCSRARSPAETGASNQASAYTNVNGDLNSTFYDAVGVYFWAWFILTAIYTVAAVRSSWVLFMTLFLLGVELLLLAIGYMLRSDQVLLAGNAVGFAVAFGSCQSPPPPRNRTSRLD